MLVLDSVRTAVHMSFLFCTEKQGKTNREKQTKQNYDLLNCASEKEIERKYTQTIFVLYRSTSRRIHVRQTCARREFENLRI